MFHKYELYLIQKELLMKKSILLEVPDVPNRYWYLIWIERIEFLKKHKKVKVTFINKESSKNYLNDLDRTYIYTTNLSVSFLSDLSTGVIYDSKNKCFITPEFQKSISCRVSKFLYPTNKPFPISDILFPDKKEIFNDLSYYVLFGKRKDLKYNVLISPYVIMKYFLLNSDKLILDVIKGELLDAFKLSNLKFYKDRETGERVVELPYDSSKIKKNLAYIVAPILFLKGKVGLTFIKSIYSQILNSFLHQKNKNKITSYLKLDWRFENYEVFFNGQDFNNVTDESGEIKNYFLAHRIVDFKFNDPNPFIVDKIILTSYNSKNSTEDRENHDKIPVKRPKKPKAGTLLLKLNQDISNSSNTIQKTRKVSKESPFNIKIDHVDREEQINAYDVISIGSDKVIDGLVRETEEFNNEINAIRQNIHDELKLLESIENLNYFINVLNEFELILDDCSILINKNLFGEGEDNFYYPRSIPNEYLKIAEIFYNGSYIYLVEFGSGIIGIFTGYDLRKIEIVVIHKIIESFFIYKIQVENKDYKKLLWTYIYEKREAFYEKHRINIVQGVKHVRNLLTTEENKTNKENHYHSKLFNKTASVLIKKIKKIS